MIGWAFRFLLQHGERFVASQSVENLHSITDAAGHAAMGLFFFRFLDFVIGPGTTFDEERIATGQTGATRFRITELPDSVFTGGLRLCSLSPAFRTPPPNRPDENLESVFHARSY